MNIFRVGLNNTAVPIIKPRKKMNITFCIYIWCLCEILSLLFDFRCIYVERLLYNILLKNKTKILIHSDFIL